MNYGIIVSILYILTTTTLLAQISPQQMVEKMGRGINLGNVFSAPAEGNWAAAVEKQFFLDVASAGFTNVRIPMDFFGSRTSGDTSMYSSAAGTEGDYDGNTGDYVVSTTYLNRIEQVVDWALDAGLVTIMDIHGANLKTEFLYTFDATESEYTDPSSAKRLADIDKFTSIWITIANRFIGKSENLLFEVINEPYFDMNADEMNSLNSTIISSIRATGGKNSTRNIIITGGGKNSWEAPLQISDAILNSDDHLIATFHYYRPFTFTSSTKDGKDKNSWGSPEDKAEVNDNFESVLIWSYTKNTPVFLGEFGADNELGYNYSTGDLNVINTNNTGYADGGPDNTSRVEYYRYLTEQAVNRGFSFAAWDAGPKSGKTIHMRRDAATTFNYDIIDFTLVSYDPKNTIKSRLEDRSVWIDAIKNALLHSGNWPLGIEGQNLKKINLIVFPNPTSNYIYIDSSITIKEIKIYTVLGASVFNNSNFNKKIFVRNLTNGLYHLKIILENGSVISKKILIDK